MNVYDDVKTTFGHDFGGPKLQTHPFTSGRAVAQLPTRTTCSCAGPTIARVSRRVPHGVKFSIGRVTNIMAVAT